RPRNGPSPPPRSSRSNAPADPDASDEPPEHSAEDDTHENSTSQPETAERTLPRTPDTASPSPSPQPPERADQQQHQADEPDSGPARQAEQLVAGHRSPPTIGLDASITAARSGRCI